jgi:hypothetical protein
VKESRGPTNLPSWPDVTEDELYCRSALDGLASEAEAELILDAFRLRLEVPIERGEPVTKKSRCGRTR